MSQAPPVRRVVTGHDATGKAIVLFDSADPYKEVRGRVGVATRALWMTESTPAQMDGAADRAAGVKSIAPPSTGTIFRIVDFPSMTDEEMAKLDPHLMAHQVGQSDEPSKYRPPTHPFMHRTRSVDYAIVMSGEIDMQLDDSTIHVKAGDVVIQQGTNHAWINRSGTTCRVAFVLIGAQDPFA
ncbi:MAG TPA: cupin domain-containing protein [Candidatus Binatia bacterium]|nr:cupin domain-containing protein [Candidatus Binatia bacterium]